MARKKTMKTLCKELGFSSSAEYYDYIVGSHTNGNLRQCVELFKAMPDEGKKDFFSYVYFNPYCVEAVQYILTHA